MYQNFSNNCKIWLADREISLKPFQKGMISIYLICVSHYIYVLYQQCCPPPNQGSIACDVGQIHLKGQSVLMKVWNQKKKALLSHMIYINHPAVISAVLISELIGEHVKISVLTFKGRFLAHTVITNSYSWTKTVKNRMNSV